MNQGGLLPADEARGALDHLDRSPVSASQTALLQGPTHRGHSDGILLSDGQDNPSRPHRLGRHQQPIDDQMGPKAEEEPVLTAQRLTLHGIANHDRMPTGARARCHQVQLARGRIRASATAPQTAPVHLPNEGATSPGPPDLRQRAQPLQVGSE